MYIAAHLACLGDEAVDDGDAGGLITAAPRCLGMSGVIVFCMRDQGGKEYRGIEPFRGDPKARWMGLAWTTPATLAVVLLYGNAHDAPQYARVEGWFTTVSSLAEDARCTPREAPGRLHTVISRSLLLPAAT